MTAALMTIEQRRPILDDAMASIMDGQDLESIAQRHGLKKRTLNAWLLSLGDEYRALKEAYIDSELIEASEAIERAGDALAQRDVPRARAILEYGKAKWNRATWIAERRDRARYGNSQTIDIKQAVTIDVRGMLEERLKRIEGAIEGEARVIDPEGV